MHTNFCPSNPAILIPVHKITPSWQEEISLIQCQKVLGNYPIYLLHPEFLDTKKYELIFPSLKRIICPTGSMDNISSYNRLMISPFLFSLLKAHTHILVHEPDAIVLKDKLQEWIAQNYDFIGAPWFRSELPSDLSFNAGGNFGLSLIKINTINALFLANPRWYKKTITLRNFIRGLRGCPTSMHKALLSLGSAGRIANAYEIYQDHCDIFWSTLIPKIIPTFKVAPPEKATYFSWDANPKKSFDFCNGILPFGMHGWHKYNFDFTKQLLMNAGVDFGAASKTL